MKQTFIWATIFGFTAIALGALGAHALKSILSETSLRSFEVGVRYQMYHSLFLLAIGILQNQFPKLNLRIVRNLTIAGVVCFSFSIYFLALQAPLGLSLRFLGPITPLGGILLMSAWAVLFVKILKMRSE